MPPEARPSRAKRSHLRHEKRLRAEGIAQLIAGIDEAGRGPLAGPVVAAAVVLPEKFRHRHLRDSKKLNEESRTEIYLELTTRPDVIWAAAALDAVQVDRLNILRAAHQAMRQAVLALACEVQHALIDGLPVRPFPLPQTAIVGGDDISLSIAAASVIAKVTRDRLMHELDAVYPAYGFARHKGYSTPEHLAILARDGPCPIHRYSFWPVAQPDFAFMAAGSAASPGLAGGTGGGAFPEALGLPDSLSPISPAESEG